MIFNNKFNYLEATNVESGPVLQLSPTHALTELNSESPTSGAIMAPLPASGKSITSLMYYILTNSQFLRELMRFNIRHPATATTIYRAKRHRDKSNPIGAITLLFTNSSNSSRLPYQRWKHQFRWAGGWYRRHEGNWRSRTSRQVQVIWYDYRVNGVSAETSSHVEQRQPEAVSIGMLLINWVTNCF